MQKAEKFGITGFVKNSINGTVYIEAEGLSERLELFIQTCKQGPSHAWIEKVDVQYCPVQNFEGFRRS
jgi:acylphosphatase